MDILRVFSISQVVEHRLFSSNGLFDRYQSQIIYPEENIAYFFLSPMLDSTKKKTVYFDSCENNECTYDSCHNKIKNDLLMKLMEAIRS